MDAPASSWLDILRSPVAILTAIGVLVRWVIAPAVSTYNRRDLQPELNQLRQMSEANRLMELRLAQAESAVTALRDVPESLARIEEQLKTLFHTHRNPKS